MVRINLLTVREPSSWARLMFKVRADRRAYGPLWHAVQEAKLEQRADGEARGLVPCELPWCGCRATHRWLRTAAEIKASRVRRNKATVQMEPESIRCETHVPDWRVANYVPFVQGAAVAA